MAHSIKMSLSQSSVRKAIRELKKYSDWVERKTRELGERISLIGAQEAASRFGAAIYDGDNSVKVNLSHADDSGSTVWTITASGQAVAFIEFGAGVYHNPSEPYPNRPANVARIGEYGEGKGKRQGWVYFGSDGEKHFTRGNPAAMPMFYASEEMKSHIIEVARQVFGSG